MWRAKGEKNERERKGEGRKTENGIGRDKRDQERGNKGANRKTEREMELDRSGRGIKGGLGH